MKVKKLLKNSLRYVPQVLVLFSVLTSNVFFPALAIAQELESSIDIPVIDDSEDILEDGISTSIYEEGIYTVHTVVENQEYVYPDNVDVRVRFNEVSEDGNLVIKRVVLSEEEKSSLNTSDDYGWDITSSMSNGSFNYDLTLPNTQGDDVEVKYTEDGSTYVNTGEFTVNEGSLVITDLDHFTIFVVSGIDNSGTCTGASITEPSGTSACYNTIQAAINAASTESEIYVDSSYDSSFEAFPILVNKEVKIYGAQKGVDPRPSVGGRTGSETVVDGRSLTGDSIFKVTVNNVTIEGFTIKNGYVDYGAVYVGSVKNTKILRNIFLDNYADLYIVGEGSSIFEGNKSSADNSGGAWGSIVIENSSNNEIKNNYISKKYSSQFVIYLSNSSNNKIFDNILDKNNIGATPGSFYSAIYLETSSNNEIRRNTVSENLNNGGISLNAQSNNNIVSKNIITNNNIPTQPEGIKGSGIFLESSDSNTVTGNTIKEQKAGIRLENSSSNEIKVNILDQNDNGINLYYTGIENENKNNKIKYNEIYNNISQGIYFQGTPGQYQDNSTTISFNNIYGNGKGIHYDGTNTVIAGSNWWGNLTGPSVATPVVGQGDLIVGDITYKEWLCEPYSTNWISQNGVCSIEAPSTLGWNISSLTSNPGETPTKLSCDSYTSDNTPSHVWSGVQVKNVKYQRQAKTPTGGWWTDPMIYTETHTPVVWFGNKTNGVEGEWNTRVRAWIDTNENGTWDDTDLTSNSSINTRFNIPYTRPTLKCKRPIHRLGRIHRQFHRSI